jgi:hypothetical protein
MAVRCGFGAARGACHISDWNIINRKTASTIFLLTPMLLVSCIPPGVKPDAGRMPPASEPAPIPPPPRPSGTPSGGTTRLSQPSANLRKCLANLDRMHVRYVRLSDIRRNSCHLVDAVEVHGVGSISVPQVTLRCETADRLAHWLSEDLSTLAKRHLNSAASGIGTMGSFVCRNVVGIDEKRLSDHAFGNAVDVSAVKLADGRRLTVTDGWHGDPDEQAFWRALRAAACKRFNVTLSPDYNAAHFNHLHFDMGAKRGCR